MKTKESEVNVFPNPAKDKVIVKFGAKNLWKSATILNSQGKIVRSFLLEPGLLQQNLAFDLSAGLYFLRLKSKEGSVMRRLVVE